MLIVCHCPSLLAEHAPTADSLYNDTATVNFFLKKGQEKIAQNEIDSAEAYYKKAGALAGQLNYNEGMLEYLGRYTGLLHSQLRYQDALQLARQQLALSKKVKNRRKEANAYNNIAVQYMSLDNLPAAAEHLIEALKISETLNDPKNQQKFYSNLANIFYDLKDKEKSLYYANKGHDLALQIKDSSLIARSLVSLSISEVLNNQLQSAIDHCMQIIALKHKIDITVLLTTYINLGEIYNKQGKYEEGLSWFTKALPLLPAVSPDYNTYVSFGLANSHAKLGQYRKANLYYDKMLRDAEQQFSLNEIREVYLLGSELKEELQQLSSALELRKKYNAVNDSLSNAATRSAIQEMEIRYQTSVKEKAIAQQQLQISNHQYEIQTKNKWILLAAATIVLLASTVLISYLMRMQKRKVAESEKNNQLLQAQLEGEEKERSRTAKELHDGVGSILSAAKMHLHGLNSQHLLIPESGTYGKTLSLLESAIQEVRNISHNMAPEVVLAGGLEYAVQNYCIRASTSALPIEQYTVGHIPRLKADHELLIYRIIQEAVNNILKHSQATQAIVQLSCDRSLLTITIEDNGTGFDTSHIHNKGIGLSNLLTRVALLNGNYQLNSAPGEGTSIYLEIPIAL